MRPIFTLFASFLASAAFGQITITQSDMPSQGDTIRVSYASNTANVNHTATGPNFTWNFSALTPNAQQVLEFATPTALPFNFTATYGVLNPSPDSIPFIGAIPTNFVDYYKNGSSGYRQVGSSFDYAPLGNFSIPIIYTSSDYVYRFPMNYNNIDSSDAAYSFQLPGLAYFGQERHRVNRVDGWGTLITPFGTFQTLRVRSVIDAVDTISFDTTGTGFTFPRPQVVEYKWLSQNGKIALLEVEAQVFNNIETVTNVIYRDSLRANVFQVGIVEPGAAGVVTALYPNPAQDELNLFWTQTSQMQTRIEICDLYGRVVWTENAGTLAQGAQSRKLNVATLNSGVYLVRIHSENGSSKAECFVKR
ncbi:MAG: T9SS type A sorting domain-containing protein [Bacteroidetes bacterium]|nr:T9SS type A sorting domain-containing protein [Bacteroidota bacterium]